MARNSQNAYVLSDGIAAQEIASVKRYLCKSTTESVDVLLAPPTVRSRICLCYKWGLYGSRANSKLKRAWVQETSLHF